LRKAKAVYVAGTRQNEGKTTLSLGIIGELVRRGLKVGFIKPVGQQYVEAEGVKVDKDSLLLMRVFHVEAELADTSPVAVDRYFTRNYIDDPHPETLRERILGAYERVAAGKDIVIVEGTGHAGVGGVIDLSNAQVAKLLNAPVVLISSGGIGRPIDEFILNRGVFEREGVRLAGVVVNKILEDRMASIGDYLRRSLEYHGMDLLGVLPEAKQLSRLTLRQVTRDIDAEVMVGEDYLDNPVQRLIVGAMTAHNALSYLAPGVLMITGGDRDDLLLAAAGFSFMNPQPEHVMAGIILTGGMVPHTSIREMLQHGAFPVLLHEKDSYSVAAKVHNLVAKIQVQDTTKHHVAMRIVREHFDVDRMLELL
jgi:BioD-like phosphotransacetylase family protein